MYNYALFQVQEADLINVYMYNAPCKHNIQ